MNTQPSHNTFCVVEMSTRKRITSFPDHILMAYSASCVISVRRRGDEGAILGQQTLAAFEVQDRPHNPLCAGDVAQDLVHHDLIPPRQGGVGGESVKHEELAALSRARVLRGFCFGLAVLLELSVVIPHPFCVPVAAAYAVDLVGLPRTLKFRVFSHHNFGIMLLWDGFRFGCDGLPHGSAPGQRWSLGHGLQPYRQQSSRLVRAVCQHRWQGSPSRARGNATRSRERCCTGFLLRG